MQQDAEKPSLLTKISRISVPVGLAVAFINAAPVVMGDNGALTQITDDAADVTGQGMTHGDDVSVTQSGESTEQDIHDSASPWYWNNGIIGNMLTESQEAPDTEDTTLSEGETAGIVGNMFTESQAEHAVSSEEQELHEVVGNATKRAGMLTIAMLVIILISGGASMLLFGRLNKDSLSSDEDTDDAPHDDRAAVVTKWQEFSDRHEAIKRKVYDSTVDWDTVFFYQVWRTPPVDGGGEQRQVLKSFLLQ